MLRFLSALFASATPDSKAPNRALINAAIERAVDGTDRRLRAVADYRQRLYGPVERTVDHVIDMVDRLPAPTEISQHSFGTDAKVRAFFSSGDHLREVLGRCQTLRDCLEHSPGLPPDAVFGLLSLAMEERHVLGMALDGDTVRRDVAQVSVNFSDHRYLCPAFEEADSRRELKKRAFDFLVERALERLAEEKQKRGELEHQRHLRRRKLAAMQAGNWGLGAMFGDSAATPPDLAALETEIEAIDAALGQSGGQALSLEDSLAQVAAILDCPADWLALRERSLRLDYRGIQVTELSPTAPELRLMEIYSGTARRRIVLFGRIPRHEIPERPDFLRQASRYLN
ncbi:hypothetical protein [Methylomagnum sp.]